MARRHEQKPDGHGDTVRLGLGTLVLREADIYPAVGPEGKSGNLVVSVGVLERSNAPLGKEALGVCRKGRLLGQLQVTPPDTYALGYLVALVEVYVV